MINFKWQCPYCNQNATIQYVDVSDGKTVLSIKNYYGTTIITNRFIVCPNDKCKKFTLEAALHEGRLDSAHNQWIIGKLIQKWNLIPQSNAKVFPDYIPKAIVSDYEEAHAILNLSPKAAATLARRCLQGMIHDFYKIHKRTLKEEIEALQPIIDPITWEAIDSIRKIGNIGAHMEKDIDLIIEVDTGEANLLLNLIEQLIEEWYIHKHEREKKLLAIKDISTKKGELKKGTP